METPEEKINRLRRNLHVHSVVYYHLDTTIVTDALFDKWAVELVELQSQYPELIKQGYLWEYFEDWTGDTGMHLPVDDRILSLAEWLVSEDDSNNLGRRS